VDLVALYEVAASTCRGNLGYAGNILELQGFGELEGIGELEVLGEEDCAWISIETHDSRATGEEISVCWLRGHVDLGRLYVSAAGYISG
jgi:hypothetical protein